MIYESRRIENTIQDFYKKKFKDDGFKHRWITEDEQELVSLLITDEDIILALDWFKIKATSWDKTPATIL